jgi:hypothetical protein
VVARRASRLRRVRRPLLALLVLLVAFGIGYGVRAARSDTPAHPPSVSTTAPRVSHT